MNRQATVPTEDAGGLPAAKYLLGYATRVAEESLTTTKRKSDHPVGIDNVPGIEIRSGVVLIREQRVDDKRRAVAAGPLQAGSVVERMAIGVVEVKRDVVT